MAGLSYVTKLNENSFVIKSVGSPFTSVSKRLILNNNLLPQSYFNCALKDAFGAVGGLELMALFGANASFGYSEYSGIKYALLSLGTKTKKRFPQF